MIYSRARYKSSGITIRKLDFTPIITIVFSYLYYTEKHASSTITTLLVKVLFSTRWPV
jgi:hypothetical protein